MTRLDAQIVQQFINTAVSKGYTEHQAVQELRVIEVLIEAGRYDNAYKQHLEPMMRLESQV